MDAKDKANEIFNNCCDYADYTDEDSCFTERETMYKNAKSLSLIMVNEILKLLEKEGIVYGSIFWENVKTEIENIEICNNNLSKLPKKYTADHLKYSYEQGILSNNPNYCRSFENVLGIINNN